jgi:Fur family transcriptional regulator, ferric uptake regulator
VPDSADREHGRDWRAELRARGYRLTPQRELVLAAVQELGHATPDEVLAHARGRVSSINASTVYRTLEVLEELGLVRHTHLSDRAPTYHSTTGHEHFHLKCRGCQEVTSIDVEVAGLLTRRLADEHGFEADVGHLTVFGLCRRCR